MMIFKTYFDHLFVNNEFFFSPIIDNLRNKAWYARGRVSNINLNGVMKVIHEVGLAYE